MISRLGLFLAASTVQTYDDATNSLQRIRFKSTIPCQKEMQNTIAERLKFLIDHYKLSVRAFSSSIGATDTNTRNYIDRGAKPNSEYLEKLLRRFNDINPSWLLLGDGEPFLPGSSTTTNTANIKNNSGIGINNGSATITLEACQRELEAMRRDAASYQREIELLKGQLETKDNLIASKDELLNFLRGGFNRPN